jgi:hypothetical protein
MVLLDSVGAELLRRHGGPGDKFTSGAAGRLVCASASGGVLPIRTSKFGISCRGAAYAVCSPMHLTVAPASTWR